VPVAFQEKVALQHWHLAESLKGTHSGGGQGADITSSASANASK
jgi:hypothetical protein